MVGFATLETMGIRLRVVNGESWLLVVVVIRALRTGRRLKECRVLMFGEWQGFEGFEGVVLIGLDGVGLLGSWSMCLHCQHGNPKPPSIKKASSQESKPEPRCTCNPPNPASQNTQQFQRPSQKAGTLGRCQHNRGPPVPPGDTPPRPPRPRFHYNEGPQYP